MEIAKYLARKCIHCKAGRRYCYLAEKGKGEGYDVYNNVDPAIDQSCVCFFVWPINSILGAQVIVRLFLYTGRRYCVALLDYSSYCWLSGIWLTMSTVGHSCSCWLLRYGPQCHLLEIDLVGPRGYGPQWPLLDTVIVVGPWGYCPDCHHWIKFLLALCHLLDILDMLYIAVIYPWGFGPQYHLLDIVVVPGPRRYGHNVTW